ncbi:MAG TPA: hypothetical protein VJ576_06760 [Rhodocyclaceae bacterium]|nr:hypothetical protein [Rhodocyclaceae bacterium]
MIDRQLITYAFLAQTNPVQGDLLSGLAPIVKPIARELAGQPFDAKEFSRRVEELYQISIHPWVADDLAPRLEKAGLLVKTQVTARVTSYAYAEIPQEFDEVGVGDIRRVLQRFVDYARPLLARHKLALDDAQLEEAFLRELTSLDFHAALLRPGRATAQAKAQIAKASTLRMPTKAAVEEQTDVPAVAEPEALALSDVTILCAGFILAMYQAEPDLYDLILRIATGAMVAEAVLNLQSPGGTASLNGLRIVLDGPFIMALLDMEERNSTAYAKTLCDQMCQQGALLQVFRHSVDEVRAAVEGTLRAVDEGHGKGALARRVGVTTYRQYVTSVLQNLEDAIGRLNVSIVAAPTSDDSYAFFSGADETAMTEYLGHYENHLARERDAASVAAVMRLRRSRRVSMGKVHQAQVVFVTSNIRVADRADRFTVSHKMRADREVPPVFTDRQLASLLFVMFGGQGKELTQYQLLANCAKALEPNNDVMRNMHRFLSGLDPIRAAQFRAVMTEDRASQHLVQLTLGEGCISSTQDATAMLEQLERQLGEENRRQFDERVAELTTQHKTQTDAITQKHQEEVAALQAMQEDLASKLAKVERERVQDQLDRDAAIQSREALNNQVQSLFDARRQETKGKLELCAQYAHQRGEWRHREFSWGVVIVLLGCAVLASGVIPDDYKVLFLIGSFVSSGLGGVVFSRNPEKILGGHFARVREAAYRLRALELGVNPDDPDFVVNLENGTVALAQQPGNS